MASSEDQVLGPPLGPPYPGGSGTEVIKEDIARTRAEMDETLDALSERLRPANVIRAVVDRSRPALSDAARRAGAPVVIGLAGLFALWTLSRWLRRRHRPALQYDI